MSRLLIISNRLPVSVTRQADSLSFQPSVGGVATGIASLEEPKQRLWFGWPGIASDRLSSEHKHQIAEGVQEHGCKPVFLTSAEVRDFYFGFANRTIWPLFHYFSHYTVFDESYWRAYKKVNEHFCREIMPQIKLGDKIWVHDYQLMLLPGMLRAKRPEAHIGFFLHIPFPSFELLRLLPWRRELLEGILGADLVGFHEYEYVRHFLSSVYRISDYEPHLSQLMVQNRLVRVDAFPMGIDYHRFAESSRRPEVTKEIKKIHHPAGQRMIISVDRLDYTKGILKRLEAYDWFLRQYPEYREKVSLVVVAVPSRTKVDVYNELREQIERMIGHINGEYGTLDWTPVSYLYRSLPFEKLTALYAVADVALITPLRDGMNLVAKEFVACQQDKNHPGVLILSEMAGAASELAEAIVINPHDKESIASALRQALEMPQAERLKRNRMMQERLRRYTVARWAGDFLQSLEQVKTKQHIHGPAPLTGAVRKKLLSEYSAAEQRLILLDYDGTLVSYVKQPEDAMPDTTLLGTLQSLLADQANTIIIISGRDRDTLTQWFGNLKMTLIAEHGAYMRDESGVWNAQVKPDNEWKEIIRPMLELYVDRTPGAFIEEKTFSLVWHCRKSEPDLANLRTQELKDALMAMTANLNIGVFEGAKIVEVKHIGVNKGQAVLPWVSRQQWPFIFVAGDDYTDEDMFAVMPENAFTCKIGPGPSRAQYRLNTVGDFRELLTAMADLKPKPKPQQ
ncbi:MAG TPA: bifunctional alpha,alpha-trehalose-phosphate synthase (UDP-forming)/trehalose-phosphatase [Phycisphaerales bacterium]|nr:bifunctional alpha,alpha-trehalose-phosphate synthase (UDP-forming)/trehalose-phosphatase [Phycisphaerales bacterium]